MTVDNQTQALLDILNAQEAPDFDRVTPAEGRAGVRALLAMVNRDRPAIEGVQAEDIVLDPKTGLRGRQYRPAGQLGPLPGLVFFHGGGWVGGDLESHDIFCRRFVSLTSCVIVAVDYRLAPEHVYPAAVEDAFAAVGLICGDPAVYGIDREAIWVGGDSAGGSLAAIVAQGTAKGGYPLAGQLLICPSTDLSDAASHGSRARFANGYLLSDAEIKWCVGHYLPADADRDDPLISPLHGMDLAGLPPAIIATSGYDPIRDEGVAYASALALGGTAVVHHHFPSLTHGFNLLDAVSAEADRAVGMLSTSMRALCGQAGG